MSTDPLVIPRDQLKELITEAFTEFCEKKLDTLLDIKFRDQKTDLQTMIDESIKGLETRITLLESDAAKAAQTTTSLVTSMKKGR